MTHDKTKYSWFEPAVGVHGGQYVPVDTMSEEQAKQALCSCIGMLRKIQDRLSTIVDNVLDEFQGDCH